MINPLEERMVSRLAISIGTSHALETIIPKSLGGKPYDANRKIPETHYNLSDISSMWINLVTLTRNIIGSVGSVESKKLTVGMVTPIILSEIEYIRNILESINSNLDVKFYVVDYKRLKTKDHNILRSPNTPLQKFKYKLISDTINVVLRQKVDMIYINGRAPLPTDEGTNIIFTNIPYDLVNHRKFGKLVLMESYTGALKEPHEFNTKYNQYTVDMRRLPFSAKLMGIFGDKELILPMKKNTREQVLQMAEDEKWKPYMTDTAVKQSFYRNMMGELYKSIPTL